jgi:hypothetical protein
MRDRRRKNAPTSAGRVPWVSIDIVEAVASREQRCRAVGPPYISGMLGAESGSFVRFSALTELPVPTGFRFLS